MTYGVDQCRVCGTAIKPHSPKDMDNWLKAQKKPPIPEKEWRRRGFLAAPTKHMLAMPAYGCCQDCGQRLAIKHSKVNQRVMWLALAAVTAGTIVWTVETFAPYGGFARVTSHDLPADMQHPKQDGGKPAY
jgi:hypothetical protein